VRYNVVVAVDVPDVASAASAARTPIAIVIGTVQARNRQNASTGPIPDCDGSFTGADRNPSKAALFEGVDPEELILDFFGVSAPLLEPRLRQHRRPRSGQGRNPTAQRGAWWEPVPSSAHRGERSGVVDDAGTGE
jgi:hypothetical protein